MLCTAKENRQESCVSFSRAKVVLPEFSGRTFLGEFLRRD
ncbi:hypothetical protein HMPREF1985_01213 [Mitsuokella sp. oral taxon 131 str. W9106]|nr:hypothetical protein HMPREF1985_01213 [Mitsuokella sp. oral taxon 131 str. W9106]